MTRQALSADGIDVGKLDCVTANLAALMRAAGSDSWRTALGCDWRFELAADGSIALSPSTLAERVGRFGGCRIVEGRVDAAAVARDCAALVADGTPLLLFGDAFFMPWLPYFGREHLGHSFVLERVSGDGRSWELFDAYQNRTEWGDAAPVRLSLPLFGLEPAIRALEGEEGRLYWRVEPGAPPERALAPVLLDNAAAIAESIGRRDAIGRFARYYRERSGEPGEVKRFVLACWQAHRARALHATWLAEREAERLLPAGLASEFVTTVVTEWRKVTEFSFVMYRRVAAGRAAPTACFDALVERVGPAELALANRLVAQQGSAQPVERTA